MKRVVLIMVSVLILTIFISFNYLLWYRGEQITAYKTDIEQLKKSLGEEQSVSTSKINDYAGESRRLEKDNVNLNAQISSLEAANDKLKKDYDQEMANSNTKNAIIGKLKLQVDMEPLKAVIRNWVDLIDKARYEDAYRLLNDAPISQDAAKNLSEFADKYRNIKGVNMKSVELLTEAGPDKKGEIIFKTVVDVTEVDDAATGELVKGSNYLYFTMSVREFNNNEWGISNISSGRLN